jgi:hypothetical protein
MNMKDGTSNAYKILVGKHRGDRLHEKSRQRRGY